MNTSLLFIATNIHKNQFMTFIHCLQIVSTLPRVGHDATLKWPSNENKSFIFFLAALEKEGSSQWGRGLFTVTECHRCDGASHKHSVLRTELSLCGASCSSVTYMCVLLHIFCNWNCSTYCTNHCSQVKKNQHLPTYAPSTPTTHTLLECWCRSIWQQLQELLCLLTFGGF